MDVGLLEKLADTTTSSEVQLGLEQFQNRRRLRKLSDQPQVQIREQEQDLSRSISPNRHNSRHKLQEQHEA